MLIFGLHSNSDDQPSNPSNDAPRDAPHHVTSASTMAPCWKFEKLQIMPLGFGYLESSEKSEKNTQILHI